MYTCLQNRASMFHIGEAFTLRHFTWVLCVLLDNWASFLHFQFCSISVAEISDYTLESHRSCHVIDVNMLWETSCYSTCKQEFWIVHVLSLFCYLSCLDKLGFWMLLDGFVMLMQSSAFAFMNNLSHTLLTFPLPQSYFTTQGPELLSRTPKSASRRTEAEHLCCKFNDFNAKWLKSWWNLLLSLEHSASLGFVLSAKWLHWHWRMSCGVAPSIPALSGPCQLLPLLCCRREEVTDVTAIIESAEMDACDSVQQAEWDIPLCRPVL